MSLLGKIPKLSLNQVDIKGANGIDLLPLGPTVALFVKLGDGEPLITFHVINNLVTTALLGSRDLKRLDAEISCGERTTRLKNKGSARLYDGQRTTPVQTCANVVIPARSHVFVKCRPTCKIAIRGSHLATPSNLYAKNSFTHIVDVKDHNKIKLALMSMSDKEMKIVAHTEIATLCPITDMESLQYVDTSSLTGKPDSVVPEEICDAVKK